MGKLDEDLDRLRMEAFYTANSKEELARKLELSINTINKLRIRLEKRYDVKLPIYGKDGRKLKTNESPFSDRGEFFENWTAEDCITELMKIIYRYPDKVISRNFFHIKSGISESTWNRFFGTFEEFKRQAGVKLSRQVHWLEKNIAKHSSVDGYRQLSEDRKDWSAKYSRENNKRFRLGVVATDLHDKDVDPFYLRILLDTIKRCDPDFVCLGGDIFDLPEFGHYTVDPRDWDVVSRINFVHNKILSPIREINDKMQIDLVEGNHEYRLLRHLSDATPALKVVLSDLHGFTIPKLMGLDKYEINYIAQGDLHAFRAADIKKELRKNYANYFNQFIVHHFPEGKNLGLPGCNGHHHKHLSQTLYSEVFGPYEWHQLGCGHIRSATYCNGSLWSLGFALVHLDLVKQNTIIEYNSITDMACIGGKYYERSKHEQ